MKKFKHVFELFLIDLLIILGCTILSTPSFGKQPTPAEIQVVITNKIKVTKAEINFLKQKVKTYKKDEDKQELAKQQEELATLKKELKIIKTLKKTEEKLNNVTNEENKLRCKYETLLNQGLNIYKKEL